MNTLQTAFYQLPSLETIAELRRMMLHSSPSVNKLGSTDYEKRKEIMQNLSSLDRLPIDFRNLGLLRTWIRGGTPNLDRTGNIYKLNGFQNTNLSRSEVKTIAEDLISEEIIKYFDARRRMIIRSTTRLKISDYSAATKMLVETIQQKTSSDVNISNNPDNLNNLEIKKGLSFSQLNL